MRLATCWRTIQFGDETWSGYAEFKTGGGGLLILGVCPAVRMAVAVRKNVVWLDRGRKTGSKSNGCLHCSETTFLGCSVVGVGGLRDGRKVGLWGECSHLLGGGGGCAAGSVAEIGDPRFDFLDGSSLVVSLVGRHVGTG